jgi:hypothetical protein
MGGWCFEDDMRMGMSVSGMACDCGPEIANAAFPVKVYLPVMEGLCARLVLLESSQLNPINPVRGIV